MNRALANEILILHPPENDWVARFCMSGEKPNPARILAAREIAVEPPISSICSWISCNRMAVCRALSSLPPPSESSPSCSSSSTGSSNVSFESFSSSSFRDVSFSSACITASKALRSSPITSCSTKSTSKLSGTGNILREMSFITVLLPVPFGPTRPYLLPNAIVRLVFKKSSFFFAETEKLLTFMSLEFASAVDDLPSAAPATVTEKTNESSK
mmetsp:Transcript_43676/g.170886  ORF Transcript_43676/g.170886 Transcript_43676/m.170886 type:complete len:214 (+) Transcript_43676:3589-4230(+)